eukprot:TRINITY_DN2141_c0_g1_i7.p1 TRINITY_DN2141_c0_g1~~TRINITY_DN2141_c0_g1_i7.p1  ORF type:complete len:127 (+),score=27.30 TRINITY_DN2141_c0_g1_i7:213-593(+)
MQIYKNKKMSLDSGYFSVRRLEPEAALRLRMVWLAYRGRKAQRSYSITNNQQRYMMLSQIMGKRMSIKEAACEYGVKYTTAKHILNVFLREGRIEKKRRRAQKKRKEVAQNPVRHENGNKHNLLFI